MISIRGKKNMKIYSAEHVFFSPTELRSMKRFLLDGEPLEFWATDTNLILKTARIILDVNSNNVFVGNCSRTMSFSVCVKSGVISLYVPVFDTLSKLQGSYYQSTSDGLGFPIVMLNYTKINHLLLTFMSEYSKMYSRRVENEYASL